jgi:small subunit ribosomal protein S24e
MDIEIKSKNDNKLFQRKEVLAYVYFTGTTPKRSELKAEVANKVVANPDNCVVRCVENEFGMKRVKVALHVYEDVNQLKKFEPRYVLVREGLEQKKQKKDKKKAAAPAKK